MTTKEDKFFKVAPFDHQLKTFNEIKDDPYYALLWEMGTGKTFELIHVLRYKLNTEKDLGPILIVCPKAVTRNWAKEFKLFSPNPNMGDLIAVLEGTKTERVKQLKDTAKRIFIINYEGIGRIKDVQVQMMTMNWGAIVLDEAQRIKGHKTQQTKAIIRISKRSKYRYIATGTPILNSLMDIFSLYLFLDQGERFGDNFYSFQNKYFIDKNVAWRGSRNYFPNWQPRNSQTLAVQEKIYSCGNRMLKEDCLDLPDKTYITHYVDMNKDQTRIYKELKEELIAQVQDEVVIASTALTKILRLNQVTSGFTSIEGEEGAKAIRDISNTKLVALEELVADIAPKKVIVWALFRNDIARIQKQLAKYNPVTINGGVNDADREDAIKQFQDPDSNCKVFIGQQRACGLGITLTEASYAIYYSQDYSLESRLQSEDRCHRSGSEKHEKITYIDLVCKDTVDEVIIAALKGKQNQAETVLNKVHKLLGMEVK